ncbi:MAG TPA: polymer-forming cytoskeletal protein [Clostridiales bacterium]|nr:polymer-forming cytoskeletal protein [Clostridiales bacterium]HPV02196.1 polymer-forming cytoskeletal protein [Clostridiales bacterium]
MKKLAALLVILLVLTVSAVPVQGEGIYVNSDSGDEIRIFENAEVTGPVRGNVIVALGDAMIESRVEGHVVTVFGNVEISAEVTGQVVALFGKVTLRDGARIAGDVISVGSIEKAPGAVISGQEVRIFGESMNLDMDAIAYLRLTILVLFMVAVLLTGLLSLLISRTRYSIISRNIEKNPGRKLVLGVLSFIGATSLLAILLLTLIAPLLYIVLLVISTVPACIYIGRMILKTFSQKNSIYIEFITGLITATLVKLIVLLIIPHQNLLLAAIVTGLINFLIFSFGMGILMEHRYLQNNRANAPKDA